MTKLGQIGAIVENIYGEAQDIEGAYYDGKYYVVQTRP
jgi:phosphoenolpyruvate synthase/pyruvate phosphate dikinase